MTRPPTAAGAMVRAVTSGAALGELAEACNALADEIPFRRYEWLAPWWHHFAGRRDHLCVLAVYNDEGELVGLAPWYQHVSPWEGRVLRFLGSGEACADYVGLSCQTAYETVVVDRIVAWLTEENPTAWDSLELEGPSADDPLVARLIAALTERGSQTAEGPPLQSWRLALPDSWEEYIERLSKSRRTRVRQLYRKYFESDGVSVHLCQDAGELAGDFQLLVELHQRRRAMLNQEGCFASPRFSAFLRDTAELFLRAGKLRLQIIRIEGRPIAAEIDFLGGQTVYFYQSGIDTTLREESPGRLGTIAAIRRAIAEGYRHFDFMRGDEAYKQQWRAEPRRLVNLRLAAPTARGRIYHRAWLARQQAKMHLKRWLRSGHATTNGAAASNGQPES